jgi:hypothetical protein
LNRLFGPSFGIKTYNAKPQADETATTAAWADAASLIEQPPSTHRD